MFQKAGSGSESRGADALCKRTCYSCLQGKAPSGNDEGNSTLVKAKSDTKETSKTAMVHPTCLINLCLNLQLQVDILQRRHWNAIGDNAQVGMGVEVRKQA